MSKSPEAKECEKSLGKPPAVPPQEPNIMNVSDSVVRRINTGKRHVSDEQDFGLGLAIFFEYKNKTDFWSQLIVTGAVDEERRNAYDNYWIEKLSCMDKAHSINSKLDLAEIEKIEKRLRQYCTFGSGKKCPIDRTRVTQCYVYNRKETLKCSRDVETFLKCVDAHLYRAVRSSIDNESKYSKNASYAERFKRGY